MSTECGGGTRTRKGWKERERERVREGERGIRGGKGNTVETERNKVPKYLRKGRVTEGVGE